MSETTASSADFWENAYRNRERTVDGEPNLLLVDAIQGLEPGTALDLACGEGWDSIWLAGQGWQVTAADISSEALSRLAEEAQARGLADRITCEQHDFDVSIPVGQYDLVSVMFMQSPVPFARAEILRRAAGVVRPGGSLVIASHGEPHPWAGGNYPASIFPTPESEHADLAPAIDGWTVVRAEVVPHHMVSPEGVAVSRKNNLVVVRRGA